MNRRLIPVALQKKICEQARFRCGYCLTSEILIGMKMEFDHLTPLAADSETSEEKLWLACRRCNEFNGTQTHALDAEIQQNAALFNPHRTAFSRPMRTLMASKDARNFSLTDQSKLFVEPLRQKI